jgi:hypothetical protein
MLQQATKDKSENGHIDKKFPGIEKITDKEVYGKIHLTMLECLALADDHPQSELSFRGANAETFVDDCAIQYFIVDGFKQEIQAGQLLTIQKAVNTDGITFQTNTGKLIFKYYYGSKVHVYKSRSKSVAVVDPSKCEEEQYYKAQKDRQIMSAVDSINITCVPELLVSDLPPAYCTQIRKIAKALILRLNCSTNMTVCVIDMHIDDEIITECTVLFTNLSADINIGQLLQLYGKKTALISPHQQGLIFVVRAEGKRKRSDDGDEDGKTEDDIKPHKKNE